MLRKNINFNKNLFSCDTTNSEGEEEVQLFTIFSSLMAPLCYDDNHYRSLNSDVYSFQFKKDATLRQFVHDITKVRKNCYSLAEVSIEYDFMIL